MSAKLKRLVSSVARGKPYAVLGKDCLFAVKRDIGFLRTADKALHITEIGCAERVILERVELLCAEHALILI